MAAAPAGLHIVNVMPAFWQAWDSTQGQSTQVRVERFKRLVVQPNMAVYGFDEFSHNLQSDESIASYLHWIGPHIEAMRSLDDRFDVWTCSVKRGRCGPLKDRRPATLQRRISEMGAFNRTPSILHIPGCRRKMFSAGVDFAPFRSTGR